MKFASEYAAELALKSREIQLLEVELAAMRQRAEEAEALLARVKRYHEWVKDNCLWHIEANAQVGLYEMLNDMEAYLANYKTSPSPPADASTIDSAIEDWAIDTSTGTPILTYQKCSVIQDGQASAVMGLLQAAYALAQGERGE